MHHAAAGDFKISFQYNFYGLGIDAVLFGQDSFGQSRVGVVVFHFDDGLQDDWTCIEIFVHEMDGAAGEFDAVFEGLALRFESRKRREQRWMDIEDAVRKGSYEIGGEQAHVSGETDQIDSAFVKGGDDLAVIGFALESFGRDDASREAALLGTVDAGGVFAIAEDDCDFGVGDALGVDAVG